MKLTTEQLDEIEEGALDAMDSTRSLGRWTAVHDCVDDFHPGKVAQAQGSPRVARHIANTDPGTTLALVAEVRQLRATVEEVCSITYRVDASMSGEVSYCHPETREWRSVAAELLEALGEEVR